MSTQELFYTSAPHGLKPGSQGFCTVAATAGMTGDLTAKLEALSGYRPLFAPGDSRAPDNPVSWAHWQIGSGSKVRHVLSRIGFAGFDYSQRTNKFAHHIVLDNSQLPAAGPAWLMLQPGLFQAQFSGEPRLLETPPILPAGDNPLRACEKWSEITGDAGWGGALAAAFSPDVPAISYIIYPAGANVLELLGESLAMLPEAVRWQVTFNTYFTELPAGLSCIWRCVPEGSEPAGRARASRGLVIDLTKPLGAPPESALVQAARTGVPPAPPPEAAPKRGVMADKQPATHGKPAPVDAPMPVEMGGPPGGTSLAAAARRRELVYEPEPTGWPKSVLVALLVAACAAMAAAGFAAGWFMQAGSRSPARQALHKAPPRRPIAKQQTLELQRDQHRIKLLQARLARQRRRVMQLKAVATRLRASAATPSHAGPPARRPKRPAVAAIPVRPATAPAGGAALPFVRFTKNGLPATGWQTLCNVKPGRSVQVALATPRGAGGGHPGSNALKWAAGHNVYYVKERTPNGLGGFAYTGLAELRVAHGQVSWRWRHGTTASSLTSPARRLLHYSALLMTYGGKTRRIGFGTSSVTPLTYHPALHAFFNAKLPFPSAFQTACRATIIGQAGKWKISLRGRRLLYTCPLAQAAQSAAPTNAAAGAAKRRRPAARWQLLISMHGNALHCAGTLRQALVDCAGRERQLPLTMERLRHQLQIDRHMVKKMATAAANFKAREIRLPLQSRQRRIARERMTYAQTLAKAEQRLVKTDEKQQRRVATLLKQTQLAARALQTFPAVEVHIFLRGSHTPVATLRLAPPGRGSGRGQ